MSLLSIKHINTGYGKKQVLFDVNVEIKESEKVLLIGSNGSGKSTLLKSVYGVLPLWNENGERGNLEFNGENITGLASHCLISKGLMYIPQNDELFDDMTVQENLLMSTLYLNNSSESKKRLNEVLENMPHLDEKRKQVVNQLSGGERKMLTLGMVAMNKPKLLLYDEPLAGLSGDNIEEVLYWLNDIHKRGTTIVIVEHRIKELLSFVDSIIGLKLGKRNIETLNNLETIKTYLL